MMITRLQLREKTDIPELLETLRPATDEAGVADVRGILQDVRERGDSAVVEATRRLDGVRLDPGSFEVPASECEAALAGLETPLRDALEKAAARIRAFAERTLTDDWAIEPAEGITVGQVSRPLERVGIYVPGGRYPYPSTVLATGIPARVAGVPEIVFCTPPARDGRVSSLILAAMALVGGCRVFRIGGAQAVAAMAYGTETVPRCLMIAGPGNVYVAAAKRMVRDFVSVDLEAGPSEVAVYAGEPAEADCVAADLLAQLEHDPMSLAALVSESAELIDRVAESLEGAACDGTVFLIESAGPSASVALLNSLAPEHLELMVEDAESILPSITSAGCVFVGPLSAVALGDYIAGPSHVLPTGGSASRLSGLRATDFVRSMNVIKYTGDGFAADSDSAELLASVEGLERHALSIRVRRQGGARREV